MAGILPHPVFDTLFFIPILCIMYDSHEGCTGKAVRTDGSREKNKLRHTVDGLSTRRLVEWLNCAGTRLSGTGS